MNGARQQIIAQEAGSWVFRLKEDDSAECHAEFTAWLQGSPQHVAEFLLLTATDADLGTLDTQRHIDAEALLADSPPAVVALPGRRAAQSQPQLRSPSRRWPHRRAAMAMLALVLVASGVAWWQGNFNARSISTNTGEQRTVKLADGSVMHLNTRSRVQVKFSDEARVVRLLEGEALFSVAQDSVRPFLVRSGLTTVQVIGTEFNIYRHANGTTVSVVEGRVRIAADSREHGVSSAAATPVLLDAGQQAAIETDGHIEKLATPEMDRALAWRQRHLVFRSATVAEVATEFNRYNRIQLNIVDKQLATRRMSGRFEADEPQSLLDFLTRNGDVRLQQQGDAITLSTAVGLTPESSGE